MTAAAVAKNKMVLKSKLGCAFVSTTSKGKLASIDKAVQILRTEIDQQAGTGKTWGWEWKC